MAVVIFGDSITNLASDNVGGGWTSRLCSKMSAEFNTEYAPGVVCGKYSVFELGIGGDTILGISQRFESELNTRVDFADPGDEKVLVGIAVGVNDSRIDEKSGNNNVPIEIFEKTYRSVIEKLKKLDVSIFLVGLTLVDEEKSRPWPECDQPAHYLNSEIEKYNSVISLIAKDSNLLFVDVISAFRKAIENEGLDSLLAEGLHPNATGHELIASEVYKSIKNIL